MFDKNACFRCRTIAGSAIAVQSRFSTIIENRCQIIAKITAESRFATTAKITKSKK